MHSNILFRKQENELQFELADEILKQCDRIKLKLSSAEGRDQFLGALSFDTEKELKKLQLQK